MHLRESQGHCRKSVALVRDPSICHDETRLQEPSGDLGAKVCRLGGLILQCGLEGPLASAGTLGGARGALGSVHAPNSHQQNEAVLNYPKAPSTQMQGIYHKS